MIASLVGLTILGDKITVGQKWDYILIWHYKNKEIDSTDEESFKVEVTSEKPESYTISVTQLLLATLLDGHRFPTDPKTVPAKHDWALFPNGAIAFMTEARFPLENRFYRILKGILPEPKGDPSRDKEWSIDYPDDGRGMPISSLAAKEAKRIKEGRVYYFSYREAGGTNGLGQFVRPDKGPFPSYLQVNFTNTKMPGGTDTVDCNFVMKLKPEKSDKIDKS